MGTSLSRQSPQKLQESIWLCCMSAVTGRKHRYAIKEHNIFFLKRVTSGECTLCENPERPCTWREVQICGHRFHRSCLRDYRNNHGSVCPTCNAPYLEIKQRKMLVEEEA